MTDYVNHFPALLLQILKDRYDLQRLDMEKREAAILQKYDLASTLSTQHREIKERLNRLKSQLQDDYSQLEITPDNLLQLAQINRLLTEFHAADASLPTKAKALVKDLESTRLDAVNHNDKVRAISLEKEIDLAKEAVREFRNAL